MKLLPYTTSICPYPIHFFGPSLDEGPLPTVFYFAISAEESLTLDPFNQPVLPFLNEKARVFSITLPGHEHPHVKEDAMTYWQENLLKGNDLFSPFRNGVKALIYELIEKNIALSEKIGFMGLSRGGFAALHVSKVLEFNVPIVLFAPLLDLEQVQEFESMPKNILLDHMIGPYVSKYARDTIWMSIGNNDTRVGTKSAIAWFQSVCETALAEGLRTPRIELHISPSIGYKGHGTDQPTFNRGALWLKDLLLPK